MTITINLYGMELPGGGSADPGPVATGNDPAANGLPDVSGGNPPEGLPPGSGDREAIPIQGSGDGTPDGSVIPPADDGNAPDGTGTAADGTVLKPADEPAAPKPSRRAASKARAAAAVRQSLAQWRLLSAQAEADAAATSGAAGFADAAGTETHVRTPLAVTAVNAAGAVTPITNVTPMGADHSYVTEKVGEIPRAPHAMFAHNGDLILSTISRNGISKSPIYSYSEDGGMQFRSELPDANESGNYGFSFGDGMHIVAEAWEGMVDYVSQGADGPWVKNDYTHLNPHEYKNLKWGFGFKCPETGQEFMGFGNDKQPGVVITQENGEWRTLSAPRDMLFPTSMGVITGRSQRRDPPGLQFHVQRNPPARDQRRGPDRQAGRFRRMVLYDR